MRPRPAPEWSTEAWFNTEAPLSLAALRGRVVVLYAFQMLCPGCVSTALPQAQRVTEAFSSDQVAVVGLHTVFEHHAANSPEALGAFLHEYRIRFPVGVDRPGPDGGVPVTMAAYAMQGTPTLVLIDREGRIRKHRFGHETDLRLGAEIYALVAEAGDGALAAGAEDGAGRCAVE